MFKCSFLLLFLCFSVFAQKEKISPRDFEQKVYAVDSTAEAVVLYDYANTYFSYTENGGVNIHTDYHTRIRILSENATSQGIMNILYSDPGYGKAETIEFFKGGTYRLENGQVQYT